MRIKLYFPLEGVAAISKLGLRQKNPETLRWTADHPGSNYGMGVILRGKSGILLDGKSFGAMHKGFGAWIEVDSADTKRRVGNALCTALLELDHEIRITPASKKDRQPRPPTPINSADGDDPISGGGGDHPRK